MLEYFKKRKIKKDAKETLKAAHHLRNMREDLMSEEDLRRLGEVELKLKNALKESSADEVEEAAKELDSRITMLAPYVSAPALRENLEVIVVAVIVAMGFRAYFLQPFKIPTGSMQPTLNGIRYYASAKGEGPTLLDKHPIRFFKWLLTGDTYIEYRAKSSGVMMQLYDSRTSIEKGMISIGDMRQTVPTSHYVTLRKPFGSHVEKGALLWAGTRKAGDHVFVNRMAWNFRKPQRGEVSVFMTTGITGLSQGIHYIKRMVGKPGDYLSIRNNRLCIDRVPVEDPRKNSIERYLDDEYYPYVVTGGWWNGQRSALMYEQDTFFLPKGQYFMLGDNTLSSQDSRYWGAAPESNLVGPAWIVYWPFTKHFGRVR